MHVMYCMVIQYGGGWLLAGDGKMQVSTDPTTRLVVEMIIFRIKLS